MNKPRLASATLRVHALPLMGLALGALWGFHASAAALPGRMYFHFTHLNDSSRPVQFTVLFEPAIVFGLCLLVWRAASGHLAWKRSRKAGLTAGLGLWFIGATLSAGLNWQVDQVVLTYWTVFFSGAAVYLALSGVDADARDLDMALAGLAIGTLFPLIAGLLTFVGEWGVPDMPTALEAYKNLLRMQGYELATFGNRGNTAAFLMIVTPMFLTRALDRRRPRWIRIACALMILPISGNLVILQVRAAFITLTAAAFFVIGYMRGLRRLPVLAVCLAMAGVLVVRSAPEVASTMTDRLMPVVTLDSQDDESVLDRADSIREGWIIAARHWVLGIGPGAALTQHSATAAHQLQTQQAMEIGVFGLLGSTLLSVGVWAFLLQTAWHGSDGDRNDSRFLLLIGPASFVTYAFIANGAFNIGYVNTWTVLSISMLALAPGMPLRARAAAAWRPAARATASAR